MIAVCPYCGQATPGKARVKSTNEMISICEECDTIWMEDETISDHTGQRFDLFAKRRGIEAV